MLVAMSIGESVRIANNMMIQLIYIYAKPGIIQHIITTAIIIIAKTLKEKNNMSIIISESPFLPCKGRAPSFTEYIIENHTLEEIIGIPGVMTYLVMAYLEDYDNWLKEVTNV